MSVSTTGASWTRHAYVRDDGTFPANLNRWEAMVVSEELSKGSDVVWLRNMPRKPWAITVAYEVNGRAAAFYPDFVFVHQRGEELVADLLDPHHIDLADAPAKAVGLAKYAAKHQMAFGRIELTIVRGTDDIRRIDLTNEAKRDKVLAVQTKAHLDHLFDELS